MYLNGFYYGLASKGLFEFGTIDLHNETEKQVFCMKISKAEKIPQHIVLIILIRRHPFIICIMIGTKNPSRNWACSVSSLLRLRKCFNLWFNLSISRMWLEWHSLFYNNRFQATDIVLIKLAFNPSIWNSTESSSFRLLINWR